METLLPRVSIWVLKFILDYNRSVYSDDYVSIPL